MSKPAVIQTQCPACQKNYSLPETSVGHRAKCAGCGSVFVVEERFRLPTEDDILRWLNEAEESETVPLPRVITSVREREPALAAV